jgi:hypothetical protein
MKNSVLRELASMAFLAGTEGEDAQRYAQELLPKRYLKKYMLYLKNEISNRRVSVRTAGISDESTKKSIGEMFRGGNIHYETDPGLGAGIVLEHGDNIVRINVKNIIERAINGIKENL